MIFDCFCQLLNVFVTVYNSVTTVFFIFHYCYCFCLFLPFIVFILLLLNVLIYSGV